jgi:hypothetical protein
MRTPMPENIAAEVLFRHNRTCCICNEPGKRSKSITLTGTHLTIVPVISLSCVLTAIMRPRSVEASDGS